MRMAASAPDEPYVAHFRFTSMTALAGMRQIGDQIFGQAIDQVILFRVRSCHGFIFRAYLGLNKPVIGDAGEGRGNTLKILMSFWAAVALLAVAQAAQAAPKVSGKYVLMIFTQCEARFTNTMGSYLKPGPITASAVATINPAQSGELNIGVGSITFPTVAGGVSAGNARFEAILVSGGALRINRTGSAMATHAETATGPFSFTNTTFTLTPIGEPAMTWTMRAGNIVGGVARTLYLVRREDARCVNAITATR
jgi:hypothetical protein